MTEATPKDRFIKTLCGPPGGASPATFVAVTRDWLRQHHGVSQFVDVPACDQIEAVTAYETFAADWFRSENRSSEA